MTRRVSSPRRIGSAIAIVLILAVAAALRLRGLGHDSLSGDEVLSYTLARMNLFDLVKFNTWYEQIPPAHHIVLYFWTRVFGHSEVSLRMPSALMGIAAVWVLYLLIARLMGRRAGLIAALLLAVSPMHIEYSKECRSYAMAVLLGLISCDLFVRLLRRPTPRTHFFYVLTSGVLLYTHLYGAFTLLAQHIMYAVRWWRAYRAGRALPMNLKTWLRDNIAIAAVFAAWVPVTLGWMRQVNVDFWVKQVTSDDIARAYLHYSGSIPVCLALISLAVVGIVRWRRRIDRLTLLLALMLVPVIVPVIISILTRPSFAPRYGIIACAALIALAAIGLASIRPLAARLVLLAALAIPSPFGDAPRIFRHPWREAAEFLNKNMRPGDLAVVHERYGRRLYNYYVNRPDVQMRATDSPVIPVTLPMDGRRVWLIHWADIMNRIDLTPTNAFLRRAPWRIERRHVDLGIIVLELTDEPAPDETTATRASPH